jgi:hypothetical protein
MVERHDADLIVVGGDVAVDTVHAAPCAVAVAPRGYAARKAALRTIGVGCDNSAESLGALALARRIAHEAGGSLRAYTVVAPPLPMWPATADEPVRLEVSTAARDRGRAANTQGPRMASAQRGRTVGLQPSKPNRAATRARVASQPQDGEVDRRGVEHGLVGTVKTSTVDVFQHVTQGRSEPSRPPRRGATRSK